VAPPEGGEFTISIVRDKKVVCRAISDSVEKAAYAKRIDPEGKEDLVCLGKESTTCPVYFFGGLCSREQVLEGQSPQLTARCQVKPGATGPGPWDEPPPLRLNGDDDDSTHTCIAASPPAALRKCRNERRVDSRRAIVL